MYDRIKSSGTEDMFCVLKEGGIKLKTIKFNTIKRLFILVLSMSLMIPAIVSAGEIPSEILSETIMSSEMSFEDSTEESVFEEQNSAFDCSEEIANFVSEETINEEITVENIQIIEEGSTGEVSAEEVLVEEGSTEEVSAEEGSTEELDETSEEYTESSFSESDMIYEQFRPTDEDHAADGKIMDIDNAAKSVSSWSGKEIVKNLKAKSTFHGVVLTWDAVTGADGYIIGAISNGAPYHQMSYTVNTTYTDKEASLSLYSFYWVIPYKKINGKIVRGTVSPTYVFGIKILEKATNVRADGKAAYVKLSWNAVSGADGYLIKVRRGLGSVMILADVTSTEYIDTGATKDEFSFYWVIPYKKYNQLPRLGEASDYVYARIQPGNNKNIFVYDVWGATVESYYNINDYIYENEQGLWVDLIQMAKDAWCIYEAIPNSPYFWTFSGPGTSLEAHLKTGHYVEEISMLSRYLDGTIYTEPPQAYTTIRKLSYDDCVFNIVGMNVARTNEFVKISMPQIKILAYVFSLLNDFDVRNGKPVNPDFSVVLGTSEIVEGFPPIYYVP